jgi:putative ABC transport system permease protein
VVRTPVRTLVTAVTTAVEALVAHRMRAVLTALGVVFATMSIIAVVAILNGVYLYFSAQLSELGAGFFMVFSGNRTASEQVRTTRLTREDAIALQTHVDVDATAFWQESLSVSQRGRASEGTLVPVSSSYPAIQSHYVEEGRFFSALDERQRARVVVLGPDVVDELGLSDPVGESIRLFGTAFTVIGVLERKDGMNAFGQRFDRMLVMPHLTALSFSRPRRGGALMIRVDDPQLPAEEAGRVEQELRRALRRAHRLRSDEPDDFTIVSQSEIMNDLAEIRTVATGVVVAIVGISLLVGGIGIMNIMLVSVTERTREIGIRRALGARARDILLQFLVEAALIGALGGIAGVVLGAVFAIGVSSLIPGFPEVSIDRWSVTLAFVFSVLTGIVFGLYPAARASRLKPSDALRYE